MKLVKPSGQVLLRNQINLYLLRIALRLIPRVKRTIQMLQEGIIIVEESYEREHQVQTDNRQ